MSTRFYLPSSGTPIPSYPQNTLQGTWDAVLLQLIPIRTRTVKANTAMTSLFYADTDDTNQNILFQNYISDPIAAVTIVNPTIKFQIRAHENNVNSNLFTALYIGVIKGGGTDLRGTILNVTRDDVEITTDNR